MPAVSSDVLVYLASPYSATAEQVKSYVGHEAALQEIQGSVARMIQQSRYSQVCAAASWLLDAGVHVFSPIAHSHGIAEAGNMDINWQAWAALDAVVLRRSDVLVVLMIEGWDESVGVAAEINLAQEADLPVIYWETVVESAQQFAYRLPYSMSQHAASA